MSQEPATIGSGIDVRLSSIPGGGNGLFTTRFFRRNELITEYVGPIIDHKKAQKLRLRNKHSHIRVLNLQFLYIDGLKHPKPGVGGASFANDARDSTKNNAVFTCRHDNKLGRDRVYLKATRDLEAGTEVFVSYGDTYWCNSKQPPESPPKQLPGQRPQRQRRKRKWHGEEDDDEDEESDASPKKQRRQQRQQNQKQQQRRRSRGPPLQELPLGSGSSSDSVANSQRDDEQQQQPSTQQQEHQQQPSPQQSSPRRRSRRVVARQERQHEQQHEQQSQEQPFQQQQYQDGQQQQYQAVDAAYLAAFAAGGVWQGGGFEGQPYQLQEQQQQMEAYAQQQQQQQVDGLMGNWPPEYDQLGYFQPYAAAVYAANMPYMYEPEHAAAAAAEEMDTQQWQQQQQLGGDGKQPTGNELDAKAKRQHSRPKSARVSAGGQHTRSSGRRRGSAHKAGEQQPDNLYMKVYTHRRKAAVGC